MVAEVPVPRLQPGCVLVQVVASLVSAGTERMVMEFAEKNLLEKARSRPDLVRGVVNKARQEGVVATLESVWNRLDKPMALGYSCSGTVIGIGSGVKALQVGDGVACAGGSYAAHAEVVTVPQNLVVRIPGASPRDTGLLESAAFTTLGAIAIQGIRLANVQVGEIVAVIGLGLVGQLALKILKANGCTVIGMDPQLHRARLASESGANAAVTTAEEMRGAVLTHSAGAGADSVLITADTASSEPVELAGEIARDRGVVVAIGNVGMTIPRKLYYTKELDFRVSRSYGPGRYDTDYEESGIDYPVGYVRWTENRNMQAVVRLMADGKLNVQPLISHRFPIEEATKAYDLIAGRIKEQCLGVLIKYPGQPDLSTRVELAREKSHRDSAAHDTTRRVSVGLLGAGNFATAVLLPGLKRLPGVDFIGVAAGTGVSARHAADKFHFRYCTTNEKDIVEDEDIHAVVIATRHHLHSRQAAEALDAGKHVFVEKPLALNEDQLQEVVESFKTHSSQVFMIGFNRRFAPLGLRLKSFFSGAHEPLIVHYRANAGYIPANHWTQDPAQGGGRIIGEACHFVDFAGWLVGEAPVSVECRALPDAGRYNQDNAVLTLAYPNGSLAVITYISSGDRALGKERVEVHAGGRSAVLEDFRRLALFQGGRRSVYRTWLRQDKGHGAAYQAFVQTVRNGGPSPIPFDEIVTTTRATFAAVESLGRGCGLSLMDSG